MVKKRTPTELDVAELKYRALVDKRNELNLQADAVSVDFNMLRQKKNALLDDLDAMREEKAKVHERIQEHKKKRDDFHARAKELLAVKKSKRGKVSSEIERELVHLDRRISDMERRQETTFMTLHDENELIDELREQVKEKRQLEMVVKEQRAIMHEVKNMDLSIDELFKMANEQHEEIVKLFPRAKELSEKMSQEFKRVAVFFGEMKKKRETYEELKTKADQYHLKAKEMREKILTIRKASRKDIDEARRAIRDHNLEVKRTLTNEQVLEKKVEEALSSLMKKGKIEL